MTFYKDKRGKWLWRWASDLPMDIDIDRAKEYSKMTFYEDKRGKWRWRLVGVNYEIIGCSSQGFATRAKATENARLVARALIQYGFHV